MGMMTMTTTTQMTMMSIRQSSFCLVNTSVHKRFTQR